MIVCPSCGTRNRDGEQFCSGCGEYLGWSDHARPEAPEPSPPASTPQSRPGSGSETPPPEDPDATLTAHIDTHSLTISPGGTAALTIDVRNRGSQVDQVTIEVVGPVAALAQIRPPALNLLPGASQTSTVSFSLRPDAPMTAGTHTFGIGITSSVHPSSSMLKRASLLVESALSYQAEMAPSALRGLKGKTTTTSAVRVANTGNAELNVQVIPEQLSDALIVHVVPEHLRLRPGTQATANVSVQPTPALASSPTAATLPFAVTVEAAGDKRRFDGTYTTYVKPPRQPRRFPVALGCLVPVLVLALLAMAALLLGVFDGSPDEDGDPTDPPPSDEELEDSP